MLTLSASVKVSFGFFLQGKYRVRFSTGEVFFKTLSTDFSVRKDAVGLFWEHMGWAEPASLLVNKKVLFHHIGYMRIIGGAWTNTTWNRSCYKEGTWGQLSAKSGWI